jgi:hypothetical protein
MPYNFVWNTGANGARIENLGVGDYSVTLTDANGCSGGTREVNLNATSPIGLTAVVTEPECIGRSDGQINLAPTGTAPFSFTWDRGDVSQNLTNVEAGTYAVTIEDAQGCLLDTAITVNAPQAFDLDLSVFQPSCAQTSDGAIEVNFFSAGTPPVDFQWSNGSTSQDLANLSAGDYVLSLTDSRGCTFETDTIVIENPEPLALQVESLGEIACFGDSTGSIEVEVRGGTEPYNFDWVGTGETTEDIFNLPADEYRLVVRDANSCPIDTTFQLSQPSELLTDISIELSDECDADFSNEITAITKGGTQPYRYVWSNGETDSVLTNVLPGDYQLVVQDANSCTETLSSIKVRDAGKALTIDTFTVKDVSCFGANDGEMTVKISGGAAPFRFHFNNNVILNASKREATVMNLAPDSDYSVTVTDMSTGCVVASEKKAVGSPQELSFIYDSVNEPNCFSSSDGSVFASTYGGTAPYTYQWYNQENSLVGSQEDLRNVPNNFYTGYVTDARGCRDSTIEVELMNDNDIIRFAPGTPAVQDVDCADGRSGAIDVSLLGGAAPFEYRWSNNRRTEDIANLAKGAYTLTVTDADTCRIIFPAIIVDGPDEAIAVEGKVNDILCYGDDDGAIEVEAFGGTAPYSYVWEYRGDVFTSDTTALTGLNAGTYTVTVRDTNSCEAVDTFEIMEPPELQAEIAFSENNAAQAIVSGGVPEYDYLWNTGDTASSIMVTQGGTYTVTVTDANNCEVVAMNVLNADFSTETNNTVRVYPNPSDGNITLDVELSQARAISFEIWSALGQRVHMQRLGNVRQLRMPIDLRAQPSGIYWMNIFADGQRIYSEALQIR